MPLELTALDSSRQLMERLQAQRIERLELQRQDADRAQLDRARNERELSERTALESVQGERFETNRVDPPAEARAERVRSDEVLVDRQTDRFLAERARIDGPQAYAAQAPRVDSYAQLDVQQAERIQATRDSIDRADAGRLDRVQLSNAALSQVQFF